MGKEDYDLTKTVECYDQVEMGIDTFFYEFKEV